MNIYNYPNKNYLEENLGEILCLLEERSKKLNMNNNLIKDNLNFLKKFERENLKKKEIIFEKEKENKLLKHPICSLHLEHYSWQGDYSSGRNRTFTCFLQVFSWDLMLW